MPQKTILKNKLKLLLVPYAATQAVTVLVLVKIGSKYEKKEINGISHFLEHMLFKGTKKRPTQIEVAETLEKVGGVFNAFTGEEYTGYYAKVASVHFELAMDWVSDIYLNSIIPKEEIKKERKVIIEEINMYNDNPMADVQRLWKKLLYGDQPAGWDIAGRKSSIKKIQRNDLLSFLRKNYVSNNTLICIAGNFDQNYVKKLVQKYFYSFKPGKPFSKPPVAEIQKSPAALVKTKNTEQTHLCLGVRAYNIFHPKRYALSLLAEILGGMMSSRLFTEVREKRGLAYYISTSIENDPDTGYLVSRVGVDNKKALEAIRVILKEYKKVAKTGVSEEELIKAKECTKGRMALSLESSDALAFFYGGQEILKNETKTPEQVFKEVDKVKKSDILKVARDIFRPNKLNLALIGPFRDKKKFQRLLNTF
jgi:predicted Zn-dependent peptidase